MGIFGRVFVWCWYDEVGHVEEEEEATRHGKAMLQKPRIYISVYFPKQ